MGRRSQIHAHNNIILPQEYNGEAQNWAGSQNRDGVMHFANSAGLMIFDGNTWSCKPVAGFSVVRSVCCEGDRVYVGAFEEFGYFKKDRFGDYSYTSLSDSLKGYTFGNEDVWNIVRSGEKLYFQSFNSVFAYDGHDVETLKLPANLRPLYIFSADDVLYAQMDDDGFYRFDNHKWSQLISRSDIGNDNIISLNILPGTDDLLLTTEHSGLYRYLHGKLYPFPTDIDPILKTSGLNRHKHGQWPAMDRHPQERALCH